MTGGQGHPDEQVADYALRLLVEDRITEPLDLAFVRLWRARRTEGESAAMAMLTASVVDVVRAVASAQEISEHVAEQTADAFTPADLGQLDAETATDAEQLAEVEPGEVMPLGALAAGVHGKWVAVLHSERPAVIGPVWRVMHWTTTGVRNDETGLFAKASSSEIPDALDAWPSRTPCVVYDTDPTKEGQS